jgi:hypothetical protein
VHGHDRVTALSQSGVLGVAATIVLYGNARPVIEGILEPRITGKSSRDDAALAGGERLVTGAAPQRVRKT